VDPGGQGRDPASAWPHADQARARGVAGVIRRGSRAEKIGHVALPAPRAHDLSRRRLGGSAQVHRGGAGRWHVLACRPVRRGLRRGVGSLGGGAWLGHMEPRGSPRHSADHSRRWGSRRRFDLGDARRADGQVKSPGRGRRRALRALCRRASALRGRGGARQPGEPVRTRASDRAHRACRAGHPLAIRARGYVGHQRVALPCVARRVRRAAGARFGGGRERRSQHRLGRGFAEGPRGLPSGSDAAVADDSDAVARGRARCRLGRGHDSGRQAGPDRQHLQPP